MFRGCARRLRVDLRRSVARHSRGIYQRGILDIYGTWRAGAPPPHGGRAWASERFRGVAGYIRTRARYIVPRCTTYAVTFASPLPDHHHCCRPTPLHSMLPFPFLLSFSFSAPFFRPLLLSFSLSEFNGGKFSQPKSISCPPPPHESTGPYSHCLLCSLSSLERNGVAFGRDEHTPPRIADLFKFLRCCHLRTYVFLGVIILHTRWRSSAVLTERRDYGLNL